jgi:hypothetical protein
MWKILQHPALAPLVAVGVILLVIAYGANHERTLLSAFLRGSGIPEPYFLQRGSAKDDVAWHVRSVSNVAMDRAIDSPGVALLEDNVNGVFLNTPHAPLDLALIFRNIERLQGKRLAVGAVMAWDDPDPIGLSALERVMGNFESVVTTAPLTRGATAEVLPPAFRRASLPLDALRGDTALLPVVNRQALNNVLLGAENTLAGFTFIEPLDGVEKPQLLARWDDRVVFSFSFLAALQLADIELDALQIHLGSHIRVGAGGWILPIDDAGRLLVSAPQSHGWRETSAEWLLDADPELWPGPSLPTSWLLRDDRGMLEGVFREQSTRLVPLVRAVASGAALTEPLELHGIPAYQGWVLMVAVVVLLGTLCRLGGLAMHAGLALTMAALVALQWVSLSMASLWMPAIPAILAVNVVWVLALPIDIARRKVRHAAAA